PRLTGVSTKRAVAAVVAAQGGERYEDLLRERHRAATAAIADFPGPRQQVIEPVGRGLDQRASFAVREHYRSREDGSNPGWAVLGARWLRSYFRFIVIPDRSSGAPDFGADVVREALERSQRGFHVRANGIEDDVAHAKHLVAANVVDHFRGRALEERAVAAGGFLARAADLHRRPERQRDSLGISPGLVGVTLKLLHLRGVLVAEQHGGWTWPGGVPRAPEDGRPLQRGVGVPADPDRDTAALDGFRQRVDVADRVEAAREAYRILGPHRA